MLITQNRRVLNSLRNSSFPQCIPLLNLVVGSVAFSSRWRCWRRQQFGCWIFFSSGTTRGVAVSFFDCVLRGVNWVVGSFGWWLSLSSAAARPRDSLVVGYVVFSGGGGNDGLVVASFVLQLRRDMVWFLFDPFFCCGAMMKQFGCWICGISSLSRWS